MLAFVGEETKSMFPVQYASEKTNKNTQKTDLGEAFNTMEKQTEVTIASVQAILKKASNLHNRLFSSPRPHHRSPPFSIPILLAVLKCLSAEHTPKYAKEPPTSATATPTRISAT